MNLFQRNVAILRRCDPELASQVSKVSGGILSVHTAKSGVPTATVKNRAIHSAYDPIREAEQWADHQVKDCQPGEIFVVLGMGLLYHVEALRAKLPQGAVILVVVPEVSELVDGLTVRSLDGWSERVSWLWGEPEQMALQVAQQPQRIRLLTYEPALIIHQGKYDAFRSQLREHLAKSLNGRLHIMVVGPIYGGSLPIAGYVVRALESLGHRVSWVDHSLHDPGFQNLETIRDDRLRLTVQQRFSETLGVISLAHVAEDPPDFVLAMSQAPLSMAVLEQMRRKKVVTAMWFVENFRHLTYWQQMIEGYDFWFVMQQAGCVEAFKNAGASHVSYLPLAADPTIHQSIELTEQERVELEAQFTKDMPKWKRFDTMAGHWGSRIFWGLFYIGFYFVFSTQWWMYLLLPVHFLTGPIHGAVMNLFAHKYGYTNFEVNNTSKNLLPLDFLMLGESYHNNHHKRGNNPNFGFRWFELDPVYGVIRLFHAVGIVKLKKEVL